MKQAIEKLETELRFLKDLNICDWNVLSVSLNFIDYYMITLFS